MKTADIKNFSVLYDNIVILPYKADEEVNGLVLPQQYEDKPQLGRVVKVGDGRLFDDGSVIPLKVSVGDIVLFNKYSTTQFSLGSVDYLVIREEDVVAIYKDNGR